MYGPHRVGDIGIFVLWQPDLNMCSAKVERAECACKQLCNWESLSAISHSHLGLNWVLVDGDSHFVLKLNLANLSANSCIFSRCSDTERHYHPFGFTFACSRWMWEQYFRSVFWRPAAIIECSCSAFITLVLADKRCFVHLQWEPFLCVLPWHAVWIISSTNRTFQPLWTKTHWN